MTRILIFRWAICLTLAINFGALTYVGAVIHGPYSIAVGVTGLLTTLAIAVIFYFDQKQIRRLRQENKLLRGQVVETRVALLKQWEQNRHH